MVKVPVDHATTHAATHSSSGPLACSRLPYGPEHRALAEERLRWRSGARPRPPTSPLCLHQAPEEPYPLWAAPTAAQLKRQKKKAQGAQKKALARAGAALRVVGAGTARANGYYREDGAPRAHPYAAGSVGPGARALPS